MLYTKINQLVESLKTEAIPEDRIPVLETVINYIQKQKNNSELINLNFICTHNSRRSHLSQIWAQTMSSYFKVSNVFCYSGGTEATAMFPVVGNTLKKQGFEIEILSENKNPVYSIKFSKTNHPIIAFSKTFDDSFNPNENFAAIMTCTHADENCPFIAGADNRIPLRYEDPKAFDNTPQQAEKYEERSLQIATELKYIFSKIK